MTYGDIRLGMQFLDLVGSTWTVEDVVYVSGVICVYIVSEFGTDAELSGLSTEAFHESFLLKDNS